MNIVVLLLALLVGGVLGYLRSSETVQRIGNWIMTGSLVVLLFVIGIQLGTDDRIIRNLETIGGVALVLCIGSVVGSVVCVSLAVGIFDRVADTSLAGRDRDSQPAADSSAASFEWGTMALVLAPLVVGIGVSALGLPEHVVGVLESTSEYALPLLLFGVGITVGSDSSALTYTARIGWGVLALPLLVAVGSILGGILSGMAIGFPIIDSAAVTAGFGWYSYAGVVVSNLGGIELGAVAFLANFLRELITFLILPFVARYLGGMATIAPGGATTMDVTLPMVQRVSGERFVVPALVNGIVLSVFATLLVPVILSDLSGVIG